MERVDIKYDPGTFGYIWSKLYHILLPAFTYAVLGTTGVIQYLRSEIIDAKVQWIMCVLHEVKGFR